MTIEGYVLNELLEQYGKLLCEVDGWFAACLIAHPESISCSHGCSCCCRGLFDITLLDALYLQKGVQALPLSSHNLISNRSQKLLADLHGRFPAFGPPWLLNAIPEEQWDDIMPEEDETPCVMLADDGSCLVYEHRPMTCRLNGIPLIDISGEEFFDEWCTLNFVDQDPRQFSELCFGFNELFTRELLLFHELTSRLLGRKVSEIDTIIPAVIALDINAVVKNYS